jgi:hypothetical protein
MVRGKRETKEHLIKQVQGHKRVGKGLILEKEMGEYLSKQDYKISYEKPIGKDRFDVFGVKVDFLGAKSYFIVECKNKSRVTLAEILNFKRKLRRFYEGLPGDIIFGKAPVQALLAYTGELPKDAEEAVRGFKPLIKFKKF